MRRIGFALLFAVPLWSGLASQALAGPVWCIVDPTVKIDGRVLHLQTWFDGSQFTALTGPVRYTITVPSDVAHVQVVKSSPNAIPEAVTILYSLPASAGGTLTVEVSVTVGAKTTFATRTVATGAIGGRTIVFGTANEPTTFSLRLGR